MSVFYVHAVLLRESGVYQHKEAMFRPVVHRQDARPKFYRTKFLALKNYLRLSFSLTVVFSIIFLA